MPIFGATLNAGPEIPSLPYLYTASLDEGCRKIAAQGYDAVDLLVDGPDLLGAPELRTVLQRHKLRLSAVATAGAWFLHRAQLCSPNPATRQIAEQYVARTARLAGSCGGAIILGSVIGVRAPGVSREQAFEWLLPALGRLAGCARAAGSLLLIEPLNPGETNLLAHLDDAVVLLGRLGADNVRLLADVYHIHVQEAAAGPVLRRAAGWIGHVHAADDNRRAPGFGGIDFTAVVSALRDIGYRGCVSVEAVPWPDSDTAARCALDHLRRLFDGTPIPIRREQL